MKTIVALYDEIENARDAVDDLVDSGVMRDNISLIARDVNNEYSSYVDRDGDYDHTDADEAGEAAAVGATGGAIIGGLAGVLVGMGALAIPGIGPVVAAGPIVAGLTGAGVGAIAGGLLGALVGWGIPEEEAEYYAEGVRRGGTLVAVKVSDERTEHIVDIMEDHNPVDVERRAEYWRSEHGWTGYDADADPYDADQIATYRQQRTTWEDEYDYDDDYDLDDDDYDDRDMLTRGTGAGSVRVHSAATDTRDVTGTATATSFADYDQDFRRHYDSTFATTNYGYDRYRPAYRHGYTLGNDRRYRDTDWTSVEPAARRRWEEENDGAWDDFKDAVRHGWERTKRGVS